jgi:hypothetical protein
MLTIAIEWEVYARTHSATALGLAGLAAAVPIVALLFRRAPGRSVSPQIDHSLDPGPERALRSLLALISWNHLNLPRLAILLRRMISCLDCDCLRTPAQRFISTISLCRCFIW